MAQNIHDKIIKKAATEILAPLGLFQKGKSRCWIDDNGWYLTNVEFQPSAWSKGAYLNVGVSFLWGKTDTLDETLSFDVGYRENRHIEFTGDEDDFYKKMIDISTQASEKIIYYRKFRDFKFCELKLKELAKGKNSFWNNWDMAMFYFLTNDVQNGKRHIEKLIEITQTGLGIEWIDEFIEKCEGLLRSEIDFSKFVLDSVYERRAYFCSKPSFRKLGNWTGFNFI